MTHEEYKKLYNEWSSTDSISRREEIEETIAEVACGLLHRLVNLYAMRGRRYVNDSDYRTDMGATSLVTEELEWDGETTVHLNYYDHWQYGGECDIDISVKMKYLDADEFNKLDRELGKKQLETLEKTLQSKKDELVHLTEKIGELETKISELKQEISNDHNLEGK